MRIIGGNHKGRIIEVSKLFVDRPTTDFAKEALFSILENYFDFEKISFLDLFSGTGSIAFEFASRGCENITCVEKNGKYVDSIIKNKNEIFKRSIYFNVVHADAFAYISKADLKQNIIFADPPYDIENIEKIPDLIFKNESLGNETIFVLEHSKKQNFKNHPFFKKERHYGKVNFSFFSKSEL